MLPLRDFAIRCILTAALASLSLSWAVANSPYEYTSLGVDFRPYRISASGEVVGAAEFGRNPALLWRDGVVEILGPGAAQAINNAGQIVISAPRAGDGRNAPHLWHNGTTTPLPIPPWNSDFRHYYDMNSSGHVVGQAQERAFLWADDRLIYLDDSFAGQSSSAYAINNAGKVVGLAGATGFLWNQGAVTLLPDTAMDINNRDQVLLLSAVWERGTATPLPLLPLLPRSSPEMTTLRTEAINDRGQVVARQRELYFIDVESGYGARDRSFLWDPVLGSPRSCRTRWPEPARLDVCHRHRHQLSWSDRRLGSERRVFAHTRSRAGSMAARAWRRRCALLHSLTSLIAILRLSALRRAIALLASASVFFMAFGTTSA